MNVVVGDCQRQLLVLSLLQRLNWKGVVNIAEAYLEGAEPARAPLNVANIMPRHGSCDHLAYKKSKYLYSVAFLFHSLLTGMQCRHNTAVGVNAISDVPGNLP